MYAYPATLTDGILDAIASEEKVVKYVDIPLQHASDSVLKRMKRPTGQGATCSAWSSASASGCPASPCARRSSWASRRDRRASSRSCSAFVRGGAQFDNVGVFTFSDEEGTTSFELPGRVPHASRSPASAS